ncbi:Pyruvate/Phosphoenolpyruvate kinase-like domain-containing protein [Cristinia sonorae]|uniref:Pyruvate/Phosphoenolpyruvate kinase-like domain-containing protein n=1 Tax=Cristinia sonorae TaxID=1940300 RepID=A0A8K0UWC0_9AGAR|nr:Pyruvate/Phosphoenolpyruvate kinase-like domain-containing protein [Cristinia sonorae]
MLHARMALTPSYLTQASVYFAGLRTRAVRHHHGRTIEIACRSQIRSYSIASKDSDTTLRRSWLYVPASSSRMLEKSLTTTSDVIIYDLEDSVPPDAKTAARERLEKFLTSTSDLHDTQRVAVRLNSIDTLFFQDDIAAALKLPAITTLILPKIHSVQDLHYVSRKISEIRHTMGSSTKQPLNLVASIESARSLFNIGGIASWKSEHGHLLGGKLSSLLFAAEDYCADTRIIRTASRRELLFTRSQVAITARAFGLQAIDMVCINYRDPDYLREECQDGRELGYTGKQAIHPAQVDIIQSTYVPTVKEIARAAKIVHFMRKAHANERGAIGLPLEGGGEEMIDAPMIKQAENTIRAAKSAGLDIPQIDG